MNREVTDFTERIENNHQNESGFLLEDVVTLWLPSIFILVLCHWLFPLAELGIHYTKWHSQNISQYHVEILYVDVSGTFSDKQDDLSINDMFLRAFSCATKLISLCRVDYDYQYNYPEYVFMDAYPLYVNYFEPITDDQ